MPRRDKTTEASRICWMLAFVLLVTIVAMSARANTATPDECTQTALAARQAAKLPVSAARNVWERNFIELSKYLWQESGVAAVFYRRYRANCRHERVPKHVRVENGRVRIMVPL